MARPPIYSTARSAGRLTWPRLALEPPQLQATTARPATSCSNHSIWTRRSSSHITASPEDSHRSGRGTDLRVQGASQGFSLRQRTSGSHLGLYGGRSVVYLYVDDNDGLLAYQPSMTVAPGHRAQYRSGDITATTLGDEPDHDRESPTLSASPTANGRSRQRIHPCSTSRSPDATHAVGSRIEDRNRAGVRSTPITMADHSCGRLPRCRPSTAPRAPITTYDANGNRLARTTPVSGSETGTSLTRLTDVTDVRGRELQSTATRQPLQRD